MLQSFIQTLNGMTSNGNPYSLQQEPGFPFLEWTSQNVIYEELKSWYTGTALNETVRDSSTGKVIDRYPIKINPIKGTCAKHAALLFGLTVDSMHLGGMPLTFVPKVDKDKIKRARDVMETVKKVFSDNNAGSLFITNGITSQYFGGCVFSARWRPDENRIEISTPGADELFAIPDGTDYYKLKEAWVIREITYSEARSYFPSIQQGIGQYFYTEHWTPTEYEIAVNGMTVTFGDFEAKGVNPFGIVPIVYIPHIRDGGFRGKSLISDAVKGIIREMNLRFADIGDAISDDSHSHIFVRNVSVGPKIITLADGRKVLDLGSGTGLGGDDKPDMGAVKAGSASEPMLKFAQELDAFYRREVDHPSVADGEDQGSQRSSLTLNTRMWPLVSHVELERSFWTVGLTAFVRIILTMMNIKGLESITPEDILTEFVIKWPPMLPRDREVLVNEVSIRATNNLGSSEHLMELFDDIEDPKEEWDKIIEEKKALAETMPKPVNNTNVPGKSMANVDAKSGQTPPPNGQTQKSATSN